ncbi:hypothetical protein QN277_015249 [Acacia crassicarpa]|uniref:Pentatricopeptide repeat-containing protein n=1 Tax=Acacia crassicarpa TaxID=499986 RepID=A0AAE1MT81_9FABA|nr:hypothetical protein QN277_015249 [Acacia crassicarpa]
MLRSGTLPDCYTLPIVLKAVCQSYAIEVGQQIHSIGMKLGLQSNEFCKSGFSNLYCKVGEFESAHKLFEENPNQKLGSWNAIRAGLSRVGIRRRTMGAKRRSLAFFQGLVLFYGETNGWPGLKQINGDDGILRDSEKKATEII